MNTFAFQSSQTHFTAVNGVRKQVTEQVKIKNGKGVKEVFIVENGELKKSRHPLTQTEVKNIKNKEFMPDLFVPCHTSCNATPVSASLRKQTKRTKPKQKKKTRKNARSV